MSRYNALKVFACLALSIASSTQAIASISEDQVDQIVEEARRSFAIPGIAVAVVQNGQPAIVRGYGERSLDRSDPVTAKTLFGIGSITKAFTTTALAMLVSEGKLSWDDRVIDRIPEFRMADPWVTREFRVRDLLTHRSGLAPYAGDLTILTESKANTAGVYRALANLQPASSFRSTFAYDNLLYVVAGDLVSRVSGQDWADFVQERILDRLGMDGCVTDQDRLPDRIDRAGATDFVDGKLKPVRFPLPKVTLAAGGIFCSAEGMSKWLAFNLGEGSELGLKGDPHGELFMPVTPIDPKRFPGHGVQPEDAGAYALGWFLQDSFGHREAHHGGGLPGMVSEISLFRQDGLGIIVMSNRTSGAASAIARQISQLALTGHPGPSLADLGKSELQQIAAAEKLAAQFASSRRQSGERPALPPGRYAGTYSDSWFGDVLVIERQGMLELSLGSQALTGSLMHVDADMFIVRWQDRSLNADAYVSFVIDQAGRVVGARMSAVSPLTDPSFDFGDLHLTRTWE